jgi:hypothetical protein
MPFTRRLLILLAILGLIGLPAVVLRTLCVGSSCSNTSQATARVPFCPLPDAIKQEITDGYYSGDPSPSPDVFAVTERPDLAGGFGGPKTDVAPPWPSADPLTDTRVPIVFSGQGVARDAPVPSGTRLDAIAPSLAGILRYTRPNPTVRSGVAVPNIVGGPTPRLVLEVAWKGIGTQDLTSDPKAWPFLRSLMRSGAGTLSGTTGSLPLDPAASLATIGTGGPPSEHGITGTLVRNKEGSVVEAWGKHSPPLVIATLADNLDAPSISGGLDDEKPLVGLVGTEVADQGLIGTGWYSPHDTDARAITKPSDEVAATTEMLATGFGKDATPDVLGVVLQDSVKHMDASLHAIVDAATRASGGSVTLVVAGTGSASAANTGEGSTDPSQLISTVEQHVKGTQPVVQASVAGGLFLNRQTLAAEGISQQTVVQALLGLKASQGGPLLADAFPGFAISFAKYC